MSLFQSLFGKPDLANTPVIQAGAYALCKKALLMGAAEQGMSLTLYNCKDRSAGVGRGCPMTQHEYDKLEHSFQPTPYKPEPVPGWFTFFILCSAIGFGLAWAASI